MMRGKHFFANCTALCVLGFAACVPATPSPQFAPVRPTDDPREVRSCRFVGVFGGTSGQEDLAAPRGSLVAKYDTTPGGASAQYRREIGSILASAVGKANTVLLFPSTDTKPRTGEGYWCPGAASKAAPRDSTAKP